MIKIMKQERKKEKKKRDKERERKKRKKEERAKEEKERERKKEREGKKEKKKNIERVGGLQQKNYKKVILLYFMENKMKIRSERKKKNAF